MPTPRTKQSLAPAPARIDRAVFTAAATVVGAVVAWGVLAPANLANAASTGFAFVTEHFGWLFSLLTMAVFVFMMWVGFGRHRAVPLGKDGERPEFSTVSWVAMLFSCGVGVGLLFYGAFEPLTFFLDLPPIYADIEPGTRAAMHAALAQTLFHWGPIAWSYYALVGGAVAYTAYRKDRSHLMSALLEPIFGTRTRGPLGAVVDVFAIIVTLFGTAISLGIGALQIGRGVELVAGAGPLTNAALIGVIAILSAVFIVSAVSGIKRGIRVLSNVNMVVVGLMAAAVFVAGPTLLVIHLIPGVLLTFLSDLPDLMAQSPATSEDAGQFMAAWTTYYWAWWVSWTPFVGLFIAKISRGRTLRQFVVTVVLVPSAVCLVWFTIIGGTTMRLEQAGAGISTAGSPQNMLFALLKALPGGAILAAGALVAIVIFFVTSADSASIVMASLAERGSPAPRRWNIVVWGMSLSSVAAVLLVSGGEAALSGLQSLMIVAALPFTAIIVLVMVAWAKELDRDPLSRRRRVARRHEESATDTPVRLTKKAQRRSRTRSSRWTTSRS